MHAIASGSHDGADMALKYAYIALFNECYGIIAEHISRSTWLTWIQTSIQNAVALSVDLIDYTSSKHVA